MGRVYDEDEIGERSSKRIKPNPVVINQQMRFFNLFLRHFLDHFFLTDRRIRITADRRKNVPGISPDKIRSSGSLSTKQAAY